MPGCAVHLQLASRVLVYWGTSAGAAPFPVDDATCRDAFLVGANSPDMGYFPGGTKLLTDLSHYVRSGELARAFVVLAGTGVEHAFAWGWATHVLGDALIHPLINQGVGAFVLGDSGRPLTYDDDPAAHVRVEMGVDASLLARDGLRWPAPVRPLFDAVSIEFVQKAYRRTYGIEIGRRALLASHRALIRYTGWLLEADQILGARQGGRRPGPGTSRLVRAVFRITELVSPLLGRDSFPYALTHAVSPPDRLFDGIAAVVATFADRFAAHYASRLADLPDYNLDTGLVEDGPPSYPPAARTLRTLARLRGDDS